MKTINLVKYLATSLLVFCIALTFAASTKAVSANTIESSDSATSPSDLLGTFLLECAEGIANSKLIFTQNKIVQEDTYFKSGTNCTEKEGTLTLTQTIEYPGGTSATAHGEALHINYTLIAATSDGDNIFDSTSVDYSIILLDGNKLYVANGMGRSPEKRPTELKDTFFTKQ